MTATKHLRPCKNMIYLFDQNIKYTIKMYYILEE